LRWPGVDGYSRPFAAGRDRPLSSRLAVNAYLVALILLFTAARSFAFDNAVCPYDIGDGYLGKAYEKYIAEQRQLTSQLQGKARLTVARESLRLSISFQGGRERTFSAVPCDGAPQPSIVAYEPDLMLFILLVTGWENHKVLLVSEAAERDVELPDVSAPVISPDRKFFLVFGDNYPYAHNELQLWQLKPTGPVKVWSIEPADIHFHSVAWMTNRAAFVVYYPDGEDVYGNSPPFHRPRSAVIPGGISLKFQRRPLGG